MSVISNFQRKYGLLPDGIIGKKTLLKIMEILNISSKEQLANFMGQCAHESGDFKVVFENLNYSSDGLLKIFPKYFTKENVSNYSGDPEKIANKVYSNRMGNGNESSGDGWKHRGMGFIQLTGKYNHDSFADYIGNPKIKEVPGLIATEYPFESAKYYFDKNDLWKYSKEVTNESISKLSKAINIGNINSNKIPNGLDDRIKKTKYYYNLINS